MSISGSDSFADAPEVVIDVDGSTWTSDAFESEYLSEEDDEPDAQSTRSAWFKYIPHNDGVATIDTQLGSGDTILTIYESSGEPHSFSTLTRVAIDDDSGGDGTSLIENFAVISGVVYFIRITSYGMTGNSNIYKLRVTGPSSGTPSSSSSIEVPVFGGIELLFNTPNVVRYNVEYASPIRDAVIPITSNPMFSLVVETDAQEAYAQVELYDSPTFISPVKTLTIEIEDRDGLDSNQGYIDVDLSPGAQYYWRYRLDLDGSKTMWSTPSRFTSGTSSSNSSTYAGSWTVLPSNGPPHIWFIFPAGGQVGEKVTIFGQGLITDNTFVKVGDKDATIENMETFEDDPIIPPIIDEASGMVTIAHDEVTFFIPDVPDPGAQVTVVV